MCREPVLVKFASGSSLQTAMCGKILLIATSSNRQWPGPIEAGFAREIALEVGVKPSIGHHQPPDYE